MKLNDPFGRVSRRDGNRYRALCDQLRQAGIRDIVALRQFEHNMRSTLLRLTAIVAALTAGLAIIVPGARGAVLVIAVLLLLWLAVGYVQTKLYLKRYLREECGGNPP